MRSDAEGGGCEGGDSAAERSGAKVGDAIEELNRARWRSGAGGGGRNRGGERSALTEDAGVGARDGRRGVGSIAVTVSVDDMLPLKLLSAS